MAHSNAFVQFMADTYDNDELRDISTHGCVRGCAGGMIYYSETIALFDKYRDELFEIMADFQDEMGEPETFPEYTMKNGSTFSTFANSVVWFCAEVVAYELTQNLETGE